MFGIFSGIKAYLFAGVAMAVFAMGAALWVQTERVARQAEKIEKITNENKAIRLGASLTQKLLEANANLITEKNELLRELDRAQGASDPLSDDIRRIINRMQPGSPGAAGNP